METEPAGAVGARFRQRDLVIEKDGDGTVGFILTDGPSRHAGAYWYLVQFGATRKNCRESDLEAYIEGDDLCDLLARGPYGGPDAFRRHVTAVKLRTLLTDTLYAFGASRTKLYPYQFIPLLKFLVSPYRRVLIADEVGLGKTIEAGYILQEELARGRLTRVLVVCPATLRRKWQDELFNRFNHRFDILNGSDARVRVPLSDAERRTAHPLRAIVSYQSIRNEQFIETIHGSPSQIDLLIVDEAHHCRNPMAWQSQAVSALVEQADSVVFLSATPIQTSELNLFSLLHMLVPEEFPSEAGFRQRLELNAPVIAAERLVRMKGAERLKEAAQALRQVEAHRDGLGFRNNPLYQDILRQLEADAADSAARRVEIQERLSELNLLSNVFTRTKRKDAHLNVAQRQAIVPIADLSEYEQEVYDTLSDFIFEQFQLRHGDGAARLVLVTYQRQIASGLAAAVRKFRDAIRAAEQAWNDEFETLEDPDNVVDGSASYQPAHDPKFQELIREIDVDRLEREDTKYRLLSTAIREQHRLAARGERRSRKLIVFTYFRRSLDYLERRLGEQGFRYVRIDGGTPSTPGNPQTDVRGQRIEEFRTSEAIDILLTSEVSSEGIDLQFCDAIVNWDLPWNPMVVEQRIGRIDRIGQLSPRIFIINIASRGTIEARILDRLYDRVGIFERSIGELEPILGSVVRELEEKLFRPRLSEDEQQAVLHAQSMAIENQRRKQQTLEEQAASLIGHDEFFRTKLDNIRRFGRYIGGDELRLFVAKELQGASPSLELIEDDMPGVFRLPYRAELERLIDGALPRGDEEGLRFLQRLRRGDDRITFDGEVATDEQNIEPIHAQHPLVRALAVRLEIDLERKPQVARVLIESDLSPPGGYFFVWALVTESGFLATRSLMSVVIDLHSDGFVPLDDDKADQLLAQMIRTGRTWPDAGAPTRDDAIICLEAADKRLRERVAELDERRRSRVQGVKQTRAATVEATFRLRIERQRERTEAMARRAAGGEAGAGRILPAYRARLEQLETEREVQLDAIAQLKLGAATYQVLGAGFMAVVARSSAGGN